jgi:hypothetical protein
MLRKDLVRAFFNVYLDRGLGIAPSPIGLIIGLAQLLPVATASSRCAC